MDLPLDSRHCAARRHELSRVLVQPLTWRCHRVEGPTSRYRRIHPCWEEQKRSVGATKSASRTSPQTSIPTSRILRLTKSITYKFQSADSSFLSGLLVSGLNGIKVLCATPLGLYLSSNSLPSLASLSDMILPRSFFDRGGQEAPETTKWSCSSRAVTRRVIILVTFWDRGSVDGRSTGPSDLSASACLPGQHIPSRLLPLQDLKGLTCDGTILAPHPPTLTAVSIFLSEAIDPGRGQRRHR